MVEKVRILKIIHLAICSGVVLAYFFVGEPSIDSILQTRIDASSLPFLAIPILAIALSNIVFKMRLKQIDPTLDTNEKFAFYQTASLVRWAILEAAAFVILFLRPDLLLLGIAIIGYLVFLRPSEERVGRELGVQ